MKSFFLGISILFLTFSCQQQSNESKQSNQEVQQSSVIKIEDYQKLKNFASGSGMAYYNDYFYIVGDDDPYLAKLNKEGEILERFQLWDTANVQNGRINKKVKPDFEAISLFPYQQDTLLLIFGSGSKSPKRDVILSFNPKNKAIDTLQGKDFFSWFKTAANLTNKEINLEGAAYHKGILYLLNRHNNVMYSLPEPGFSSFIENQSTKDLSMNSHHFELPSYKKDTARFSGASIIAEKNQILFSASIETTDNWQDDGKILGSFMGKIDFTKLDQKKPFCAPVFVNDTTRFKGKIEALHGLNEEEELKIYFITDDDDGTTGWGQLKL